MIGERIQYLRNEYNLTQDQLAKILNIGRTTLASYEQNVRKPSVETVIILANYFKVSADYILELTNKPEILNEEEVNPCVVTLPESIQQSEMAMDDFELIKEFIVYKYNKE